MVSTRHRNCLHGVSGMNDIQGIFIRAIFRDVSKLSTQSIFQQLANGGIVESSAFKGFLASTYFKTRLNPLSRSDLDI
jgi:hypothetical protein